MLVNNDLIILSLISRLLVPNILLIDYILFPRNLKRNLKRRIVAAILFRKSTLRLIFVKHETTQRSDIETAALQI